MQMAADTHQAAQLRRTPPGFLPALRAARLRTSAHIAGTVASTKMEPGLVVCLLNEALATEIACMLRYRRHYFLMRGSLSEAQKGELLDRANEEQLHADMLAERIVQLGGEPDLSPLQVCDMEVAGFADGCVPEDMVREELAAEHMAVEVYAEIIRYVGDEDVITRSLLEEILANEKEHAGELTRMLVGLQGDDA
jgi:bacterioferritin